MAAYMEIICADTRVFQNALETILHCSRLYGLFRSREHKGAVLAFQIFEHWDNAIGNGYLAAGGQAFRLRYDNFRFAAALETLYALYGVPDGQNTFFYVDILPTQGADLAYSHARI